MKIHMVKKGDTMYEIAKKYGVNLADLIAANPQVANPDQIDVGMKIKIPVKPVPVQPPVDFVHKHIVKQGDTLWKLSKLWGLTLKALVDANPQLKNPSVLMTGEVVYIPRPATENPHAMPPATDAEITPTPVAGEAPMPEQPLFIHESELPGPVAQPTAPAPAPTEEAPFVPTAPWMMQGPNITLQDSSEIPAVPPFAQFPMPATEAHAAMPQGAVPVMQIPEWFGPGAYPAGAWPSMTDTGMAPAVPTVQDAKGGCGCGGSGHHAAWPAYAAPYVYGHEAHAMPHTGYAPWQAMTGSGPVMYDHQFGAGLCPEAVPFGAVPGSVFPGMMMPDGMMPGMVPGMTAETMPGMTMPEMGPGSAVPGESMTGMGGSADDQPSAPLLPGYNVPYPLAPGIGMPGMPVDGGNPDGLTQSGLSDPPVVPGAPGMFPGMPGGMFPGGTGAFPGMPGGMFPGMPGGMIPGGMGAFPGMPGGMIPGGMGAFPGMPGGTFPGEAGAFSGMPGGTFPGGTGASPGMPGGTFPGETGAFPGMPGGTFPGSPGAFPGMPGGTFPGGTGAFPGMPGGTFPGGTGAFPGMPGGTFPGGTGAFPGMPGGTFPGGTGAFPGMPGGTFPGAPGAFPGMPGMGGMPSPFQSGMMTPSPFDAVSPQGAPHESATHLLDQEGRTDEKLRTHQVRTISEDRSSGKARRQADPLRTFLHKKKGKPQPKVVKDTLPWINV